MNTTTTEMHHQLVELTAERDHWKANHDNRVNAAKILMDRTDMPLGRVGAYKHYVAALEANQKLRIERDALAAELAKLRAAPVVAAPAGFIPTPFIPDADTLRNDEAFAGYCANRAVLNGSPGGLIESGGCAPAVIAAPSPPEVAAKFWIASGECGKCGQPFSVPGPMVESAPSVPDGFRAAVTAYIAAVDCFHKLDSTVGGGWSTKMVGSHHHRALAAKEMRGRRKLLDALLQSDQQQAAPSVPEEWREVMAELAADLQAACDAEHPHREHYPSVMRKYQNDMRIVERARALLQSANHSEQVLEKVAPDCLTCANLGRVNGLSQESYCDSCVYQGRDWRQNHFVDARKMVDAVKRRCEACAILPCSCK